MGKDDFGHILDQRIYSLHHIYGTKFYWSIPNILPDILHRFFVHWQNSHHNKSNKPDHFHIKGILSHTLSTDYFHQRRNPHHMHYSSFHSHIQCIHLCYTINKFLLFRSKSNLLIRCSARNKLSSDTLYSRKYYNSYIHRWRRPLN